ncbi:LpqB family beta-propeller domain-containing protein [Litorihabitans aurantiacus]|uniref:Lipoprotein LpqB n=1 Tax=Litorihabitans aurantiacus TaxID=1930061 RepID=A0AA37XCT9_9MICO|nr:LpqB family beta-propeller domain-containing protein [Litorihabitans aurantiacus]GMA30646.1 lipoprotein LpqB [Litorihabitans aurantiacus]
MRLGVEAVADVDQRGVYTATTSATASELTYELVRVDGQWRIDSLPSGLLLSEVAFGNVFRSAPVMFLTPDGGSLVPDVRFVPTRNAVSYALDRLLTGPADWLAPAVTTRAGSGITLEQPGAGVTVEDGSQVAEVRLTGAGDLDEVGRTQLYAQVDATLRSITGVSGVSLWLDGNPFEPGADLPRPTRADDVVPDRLVGLADGELVVVTDGVVEPYVGSGDEADGDGVPTDPSDPGDATDPSGADAAGAATPSSGATATPTPPATASPPPPLPPGLSRPAPAYREQDGVAVLQDGDRLLHVSPSGAVSVLATGRDLLAPTQDRWGWILTGEHDNEGELTAVRPDGTTVAVEADPLVGHVVQVRLSRDGTRAAVTTEREGLTRVRVVALVRDRDGVPLRVVDGPVLLDDLAAGYGAVWVSGSEVAVLAATEEGAVPGVRSALVTGPVSQVSTTTQAVAIAGGNGLGELVLSTADGRLLGRVSLRWEELAAGVTDPAYPG